MTTTHERPVMLSADTLKGNPVRNPAGEKLGELAELMFDATTGRVTFAVLSFGGIFGFREKLFAVPYGAMTLDTENHEFILDVDKSQLEKAPGFDKDSWPDFSDPEYGGLVDRYYSPDNYERFTYEALYEMAQSRDITGRSDMTKEELIAALGTS